MPESSQGSPSADAGPGGDTDAGLQDLSSDPWGDVCSADGCATADAEAGSATSDDADSDAAAVTPDGPDGSAGGDVPDERSDVPTTAEDRYASCEGLSDGDPCTFDSAGGTRTGECQYPNEGGDRLGCGPPR